MHQVKIFKGVEAEVSALEQEINDWIRQANARVISIHGNIAPQTVTDGSSRGAAGRYSPSDVLVIVLYEA